MLERNTTQTSACMELTEGQRLKWIDPRPLHVSEASAAVNRRSFYRHRILQGVFNLCLAQEHIPSAHSPQHALERGDPLPVDHTSHKPAQGTAQR